MKNFKLVTSLGILLLLGACSTGGSSLTDQATSQPPIESAVSPEGPSDEGRAYIVEVCSPIYNFDWTKTSIDSLVPFRNDFNQIKNKAASFDEETKSVIASLANQASSLTGAYEQWRDDMPVDIINNVEEAQAVSERVFETTAAIGEEINKICAPFFD
jgi:hypothetical protein